MVQKFLQAENDLLMGRHIFQIKERILDWINGQSVILIFAATTGWSVKPYLDFIQEHHLKFIVVTAHKLSNPRWKPFDPQIRKQIEERKGRIVEERFLWAILRVAPLIMAKYIIPLLGYKEKNWEELLAVGGRVCLQVTEIAIKENLVKEGDIVVAVAGENAALGLRITGTKSPKMALLEVISRPEIEL